MKDILENIIKFLRDFPDKWILFIMCLLVGVLFLFIRNDFASQLLNSVISALIGLLIGRSRTETKNEIQVDGATIETPSMNTADLNDPIINIK